MMAHQHVFQNRGIKRPTRPGSIRRHEAKSTPALENGSGARHLCRADLDKSRDLVRRDEPHKCPNQLGLAISLNAGNAHDLARTDLYADIDQARSSICAGHSQGVNRKNRRSRRRSGFW